MIEDQFMSLRDNSCGFASIHLSAKSLTLFCVSTSSVTFGDTFSSKEKAQYPAFRSMMLPSIALIVRSDCPENHSFVPIRSASVCEYCGL